MKKKKHWGVHVLLVGRRRGGAKVFLYIAGKGEEFFVIGCWEQEAKFIKTQR